MLTEARDAKVEVLAVLVCIFIFSKGFLTLLHELVFAVAALSWLKTSQGANFKLRVI